VIAPRSADTKLKQKKKGFRVQGIARVLDLVLSLSSREPVPPLTPAFAALGLSCDKRLPGHAM
jgi:hypothetical protein